MFAGLVAHHRRPIESYVHHYEGLSYHSGAVDRQHHRHKRSLPEHDHWVEGVEFRAHGRDFQLRLRRDHSVFHNDLAIVDGGDNHLAHLDLSHIYQGHLADEGPEGSQAFGSIQHGVFDGQVLTPEGTYYIERAHKYFSDNTNDSFHSVIYHERHLKDPFQHSKAGNVS